MHPNLQAFLDHLDASRSSPLTQQRYRDILRDLSEYAGNVPPWQITPADLERFVSTPRRDGRSRAPAGVNLRLAVAKAAFGYLHAEGLVPMNPAARIRAEKLPRRTPKYLTSAEVAALLRHIAGRSGRNRIRDLAIVLVLWQTGLRISEVARLGWRQLDSERRALTDVLLKGGHVLDVEVNDETLVVLLGLRETAGAPDDGAIFARYDGKALGVRAIEARFETWRAELGWTRRLHPHVLRHAHAAGTRALGTPIEVVAESLHHSGLRNVMVYASIDNPALRAALSRLGTRIPSEILGEFRALGCPVRASEKSSCAEESFHEGKAA